MHHRQQATQLHRTTRLASNTFRYSDSGSAALRSAVPTLLPHLRIRRSSHHLNSSIQLQVCDCRLSVAHQVNLMKHKIIERIFRRIIKSMTRHSLPVVAEFSYGFLDLEMHRLSLSASFPNIGTHFSSPTPSASLNRFNVFCFYQI